MPARAAANVIVGITARDDTKEGIDKAKSSLSGLGASASSAFGAASTAALGLGGVVLGAGSAALATVTSFSQSADELSKLSQRTGESTEKLSAMQHAFNLSDLSSGQLEQTLRRLNVRVDEARNGSEKYETALSNMGVSLEDLENLSPADQFGVIAEAISQVQDAGEQAALSADFFGQKLGPELLTVLQGGQAGLDDFAKDAENLGLVIGQETADEAASFNDNLDRMASVTTALGNTLSETLLPILNQLVESALPAMQTVLEVASPLLEQAGLFVGNLASGFLELVTPVVEFVESGLVDFLNNIFGAGGEGEESPLAQDFAMIQERIGALVESVTEVLGPVINTLADIFGRVFGFISEVVGIVFQHIGGILSSFIDIVISVVDFISAIFTGDFSKIFEAAGNIVNKVFTFIGNIISYVSDIVISIVKNLGSGIVKFIIDGLNGFIAAVEDAVNAVQTLFYDMVDTVLGLVEDLAKGVIQILIDLANGLPLGVGTHFARELEGIRDSLDFSVTRGGRIEFGRLETPDWVNAGNQAAAAAAAPVLDLAAGAGIPVQRTNTVVVNNFVQVEVPNFVGSQDELAAFVNRGIQAGSIGR